MAIDLLRSAAATHDWAAAAEWALRCALRAVEAVPERQELQQLLQSALADTGNPHSRAVWVASAYDLLVRAQHSRLPEERALHLRAGKDVRDAVVLCCIMSVGTHSDYALFDAACDQAFQRPVYTYLQHAQLGPQDSLYAQLHHSYQQLFKHVGGKFPSSSVLQNRRRPRRARGAWSGAPEVAPEVESNESAGESSEQAAAAAQGPAAGASPAALGAELPHDEAAAPPRVPPLLEVPEDWRQRVEDLLESIVDRRMKAEIVNGSCYLSAPGQHLCSNLHEALSGVIKRFPHEPQLHSACVDVLLSMCVRRGDVLGLQAPDILQEQTIRHLCPDTQVSVKQAIDTATQACSSDEAREELARLLVRTQPVSVVLGAVDKEFTKVMLDEAKHGLSWFLENMEKAEYRECSKAFFKEVMKQCQDRSDFASMHNWVRGGMFDSRYNMRNRFVVIGLLFGISGQILTPLPKLEDAHMIIAALKALTFLDSITPFDIKANNKLAQSIQELGGKGKRDASAGGGYSDLWVECEAEYASVLGRLLQGSSLTVTVCSYALVDWTIHEACAIVEHATSSTDSDRTPALHAALWCLTQIFEGAPGLGDWDAVVGTAERQATQYAGSIGSKFESKSARDTINEAERLMSIHRGEPR